MSVAFSTKLSHLRKEKDLTQRQVAEELGISQALLSHYENGIRECNLEFVEKAARYYGVSADYLLGLTESDTKTGVLFMEDPLQGDAELSLQTLLRALLRLYDAAENHSLQATALFLDYFSLATKKYTAALSMEPSYTTALCDLCSEMQLKAGNKNALDMDEDKKQPLATVETKATAIINDQIGEILRENKN